MAVFAAIAVAIGAGGITAAAVAGDRQGADDVMPRPVVLGDAVTDGLERHKRIASNNDGSYTLNLDVKAPTDSSADGRMPLDVSMVLDVSGSMVLYGKERLSNLKTAAVDFIDKVDKLNQSVKDPAKKHRISLVKFAGNNSDNVGDDMYKVGKESFNYTQILSHFTTDFADLKQKVNALRGGGPTQSDYAMNHAEITLQRARADVKKAVIFFTDGAPEDASGSIFSFHVDIANAALEAAKRIKDKGVTIYSVGLLSNSSLGGNVNENVFLHAISSNYPKAVNVFKGEWVPWEKWKRWEISQLAENLGPGSRQSGFYKPVRDSSELHGIFDDIHKELTATPVYKGVTITDELSEHVRQTGITYDKTAKSGDFYKVTSGAELKYSGDPATAPVRGKDYDLWFNPNGNGSMRVKFAADYMLKARETYTVSFNIEPSQKAYDVYAQNVRNGKTGADLYGGAVGSPASDMPGNATSANKPGFYSNTKATIDYTKDGKEEHASYDDRPVVQVESSTLDIVKEWEGGGEKPDLLTVKVTQGGTVTPVTLKPDKDGAWKASLAIPAGEEKQYQVQEDAPGTQWVASYRHRLGTEPAKDGDTVTVPASRKSQHATVTVTNRQAMVRLPGGSVSVRKSVTGWQTPRDFSFTLSATGANADKVQWPGKQQTSSSATTKGVSESRPVTATFDDEISLPVPKDTTKQETYTFKVVEEGAKNAPAGWKYDDAERQVAVTVKYDVKGKAWTATVAPAQVEFANHYVAVSALPLTGGMADGRWSMAAVVIGMIAVALIAAAAYRTRNSHVA